MSKEIYKNLKLYFPWAAREAVATEEKGHWELIVYLRDGSVYSYYDYNKTIRKLPSNSNALSEDECRREFGVRLKRLLDRMGITQKDLSQRTGIANQVLSRYITGEQSPSFYKVDQIAKALNCSIDEFRYT